MPIRADLRHFPIPQQLEGEPEKQDRNKGGGGDGGTGGYHLFIAGLLKTLPPADSDWPMDARRKWLQAASTIFEVIYKDSDSKGSLRIEVQKDSSEFTAWVTEPRSKEAAS